VLLVIGVIFYLTAAPTRRRVVTVPITQEMGIGGDASAGPAAGGADSSG